MKRCYRCGEEKPPDAYWRMRGGLRSSCKSCENAARDREREARVHHDWYYARGGKETVRKNSRAWRHRTGYPGWSDPVRERARNLAAAAIRRGVIARSPCGICGASKTEAHHDDYAQPLVVRFLCNAHHRAEHKTIRAQAQ